MNENIRVGVFICECGSNIANFIDIPQIIEYCKNIPNVVLVNKGKWSCSTDYLIKMNKYIEDCNINRVLIAACTPRTHETLFKKSIQKTKLNPYLLEFVSIREQVSWVHMKDKKNATQKAKDLIKMGVAKAIFLEPSHKIKLPVGQKCVVIGGGISGLQTSLVLANQKLKVHLIEKKDKLGGILKEISTIFDGHVLRKSSDILKRILDKIKSNPYIEIHKNTIIEEVKGYIGNYKIKIKQNDDDKHKNLTDISTISVTTGMQELPKENTSYNTLSKKIITQLGLEKKIKDNNLKDLKKITIINCVESKNEKRGCCNIGCQISIKNALILKNKNPDANIYILHRSMNLLYSEESLFRLAKENDIKFLRFSRDNYPIIEKIKDKILIKVTDILLNKKFEILNDIVVLSTAFEGNKNSTYLKKQLKVSTDKNNFFQERHVKLGPVDFANEGLVLAGCAKSPKKIKESIEESSAAAMRISIPMIKGYIETEGITANIDLKNCKKCTLCSKKCPFNAIHLSENNAPILTKALCKGCGLCAADCPTNSIQIIHFSDKQIFATIKAALEEKPEKKIIGFICHWCAHGGVDMAGVSRLQYPTTGRMIRVMCSARVSSKMVEYCFELGAGGILIAGCEFPTCHYISGNYECKKRINRTKIKLSKKGYNTEKLWLVWCSAADGPKYANTIQKMTKQLRLG